MNRQDKIPGSAPLVFASSVTGSSHDLPIVGSIETTSGIQLMLSAYRAYNYISCIVIITIVALAVCARHSELCRIVGIQMFYSWGLVSLSMFWVALTFGFNKLPTSLYALLIFWSPITNSLCPSVPSTLDSGITVNMLASSCLLIVPYYLCGQSEDGKGDLMMQRLESWLHRPLPIFLLTAGWFPAAFLVALTGFGPD